MLTEGLSAILPLSPPRPEVMHLILFLAYGKDAALFFCPRRCDVRQREIGGGKQQQERQRDVRFTRYFIIFGCGVPTPLELQYLKRCTCFRKGSNVLVGILECLSRVYRPMYVRVVALKRNVWKDHP